VGMPRNSFYYIVENNPLSIADIQAIIDIGNREQLALILQNKFEILEKVVQDGLSDKPKPRALLAICIKLIELVDEFMDRLQNENVLSKQDVDTFLTGQK
jgi:hypothetical protein